MQYQQYFWGTLVLGLTVVSPLPAIAQPSIRFDNPPIVEPAKFDTFGSGKLYQGNILAECGTACRTYSRQAARAKTYSFREIWSLILKYQRQRSSHFSPELIACLMWEESGFRLVENPQSHTLGFGQVRPDTLNAINKRYKTNFTRTSLLTSSDASVEATVLALEVAWDWKKEKVGALFAYAGGIRNFDAVRRWLTAEPQMLRARLPYSAGWNGTDATTSNQIVDALHICSQPGFHPQELFD